MGRSSVYGVGVNDWHEQCHYIENGKKLHIKEYMLWRAMLTRCYSEYTKSLRPTYIGVTCEQSWLSMTKFINDVSKLHGYEKVFTDGWVLDKDILVKGNKVYSLETCCFVPPEINGTLTLRKLHRGELPLGVTYNKNRDKYIARCGYDGKRKALGYYKTPEEAFESYKLCKKMELERLANKYKGEISDDVYLALLNYQFDEED